MRKHILLYTFIGFSFSLDTASAQLISFGAKGGVPLTDPTYGSQTSPRYTVGPTIEFRLSSHFSAEVDVLYSRQHASSSFASIGTLAPGTYITTQAQKGNSWQFPILGKYYFRSREAAWRPYLATGYAFGTTWSHISGNTSTVTATSVTTQPYSYNSRTQTNVGAVFAAGVRYKKGRYAILPEIRYDYWGVTQYPQRRSSATFLVGLQF